MGGTAKKKKKSQNSRSSSHHPRERALCPQGSLRMDWASAPGEHRGRATAAPANHSLHPPESCALSSQTGSTREARNTTK